MKKNTDNIIYSAITLGVLAIAFMGYRGEEIDVIESTQSSSVNNSQINSNSYKYQNIKDTQDDTITNTVYYRVPRGGTESISVTSNIKNGLIIDISTAHSYGDNISAEYQRNFDLEYKKTLINESTQDIFLSRIAGASLTTDAFMQALKKNINQS